MTISNEDILKYFMTDEYPHDAGTLAAKEKIDHLQRKNDELVARVARLEQASNRLLSAACHVGEDEREYGNAFVYLDSVCNYETKSQSLQHIQDEVVENMLVKVEQIIDEASIGISSFDATETVGEISRGIESLRQQPRG